jgi:hypothetical protein
MDVTIGLFETKLDIHGRAIGSSSTTGISHGLTFDSPGQMICFRRAIGESMGPTDGISAPNGDIHGATRGIGGAIGYDDQSISW